MTTEALNLLYSRAREYVTELKLYIDSRVGGGAAGLRIAFIGDSLTQSSLRNMSWAVQVGAIIEQLTGTPVQLRNVAIGGSTFDSALNTLQHQNGTTTQVQEVIDFAPDLVFVALGINDLFYAGTYTPEQVIATATTLIDTIRTAVPSCKIVYAEEAPHDLTLGLTPATLTNKDTLPFTHELISLNGLNNVRINSAAFNATALSTLNKNKHTQWGTATATLRTLFDGYFTADLWKMARLGSMVDKHHIDELAHALWAWQAIRYLAATDLVVDKVDFLSFQFENLASHIVDIDLLWESAKIAVVDSNMTALYRGDNLPQRMAGWLLRYPRGRMTATRSVGDRTVPVVSLIEEAVPNGQVYVGWDNDAFRDTGRTTNDFGGSVQVFNLNRLYGLVQPGNHTLLFAVANPDGSHDAFESPLLVSENPIRNPTALRSFAADISAFPHNTLTKVNFTVTPSIIGDFGIDHSQFLIPPELNGRWIRLRANLRFQIDLDATDINSTLFVGMIKNGQLPPINTLAGGLGLPASYQDIMAPTDARPLAYDINLCSAAIKVATGDVFEIRAMVGKVSAGPARILANNYSWFELETLAE